MSAIVGGTASKLTGGDFSDGAVAAAMQRIFNDDNAHDKAVKIRRLIDAVNAAWQDGIDGKWPGHQIACNYFASDVAQRLGVNSLNGLTADQQVNWLFKNAELEKATQFAQLDANNGDLVFGGVSSEQENDVATGSKHGHIVVVLPGMGMNSRSWGGSYAPYGASMSIDGIDSVATFNGDSLNYAFTSRPMFWVIHLP